MSQDKIRASHEVFRADRAAEAERQSKRGAPMGWSNAPGESLPLRTLPVNRASAEPCAVTLERVPLDSGGYDEAGHYYGIGEPLWEAAAELDGAQPWRFRAKDREAARAEVLRHYPAATFDDDEGAIDDMTAGYLACAEWLLPEDEEFENADGFSDEARASAREACADFYQSNRQALAEYEAATGRGMESAGHDLWLTRNRHGAGFWDRGHAPCLRVLTDAAHAMGESDAYVGDDNRIHLS